MMMLVLTTARAGALPFHCDFRQRSDPGTIGQIIPNCEVKVMDEEGRNQMPHGEPGELWLKSPSTMKGYWNNPEATKTTLTPDGWLKTGDIGIRDAEGEYSIVDRKKVSLANSQASVSSSTTCANTGIIGTHQSQRNASRSCRTGGALAKSPTDHGCRRCWHTNVS